MTIYNFNLLVGYESTGVDYAQGYRARILRDLCRQKYIFTELPNYRELDYYTRIGIAEEEIIALPLWLAGVNRVFPTKSYEEVRQAVIPDVQGYVYSESGARRTYTRAGSGEAVIFCLTDAGKVHSVEYYMKNTLLRRDHWSDRLIYSEYMTVESDKDSLFVRVRLVSYYDESGKTALKEYRTENERFYVFPDHTRLSTLELLERFLTKTAFGRDDLILMDRVGSHFQMILKHKGAARTAFFMHSKLTFEDYSDSHHWRGINYEYVDLVRCAGQIDAFLVSTEEQAKELREWFLREYGISVGTYVLPVGGISGLLHPVEPRKQHSLVTVSRLDHRKRIDLLIKACVIARRSVPDLSLDIYGKGPRFFDYLKLIEECGARGYVRLMGYVDNFDRYASYEGYISASLWETFGLTLLEAASRGLPIIGLDVPYGNRTFIRNDRNGYLIPYENGEDENVTAEHLAEAIKKLFTGDDLARFSDCSYREAGAYTMEAIAERWRAFLKELGEVEK